VVIFTVSFVSVYYLCAVDIEGVQDVFRDVNDVVVMYQYL